MSDAMTHGFAQEVRLPCRWTPTGDDFGGFDRDVEITVYEGDVIRWGVEGGGRWVAGPHTWTLPAGEYLSALTGDPFHVDRSGNTPMSDPVEIAAEAVFPEWLGECQAASDGPEQVRRMRRQFASDMRAGLKAAREHGWRIVKTRQAEPRALLGDGLIVIIEEWIGDE